jgi:hypothetical protein
VLAVIERCATEISGLEDFYYGRIRTAYIQRFAHYLEQRSSTGRLRPMRDATTTARLVSESIMWFAWHRREGRDANESDDETARQTVIEFVCAALVTDERT